jgi:5'-nucleotidase
MGDWVADVVRAGPPAADFGIVNSGGLRADLDEGEVTFGEVYDVMPFDNRLVHVRVTGAALREVLEIGVSGEHGVVQVSGLSFAFDYDREPGERIVGEVIDAGTGEPLEPARIYRVAVPDFLAEGGDGFVPLAAAGHERQDALIRDLLVAALRQGSPIDPPRPAEEGRMRSTGKAP